MLEETLVIKLSKNILKRYEYSTEGSVMFLFNVQTDDLWTGNESSYDLIKLIDGKNTLKEIYSNLQLIFTDYEYEVLRESFDSLITELIDKNFMEIVNRYEKEYK